MRRELQDANAPRPSTGHSARHTQGTAPEQRMTPRATAAQPRTVLRSGWGSEARSVIRGNRECRAQRPAQGTAPRTGHSAQHRTDRDFRAPRPTEAIEFEIFIGEAPSLTSAASRTPRSAVAYVGFHISVQARSTWTSTRASPSPCRRVRLGHSRGLPHLRAGWSAPSPWPRIRLGGGPGGVLGYKGGTRAHSSHSSRRPTSTSTRSRWRSRSSSRSAAEGHRARHHHPRQVRPPSTGGRGRPSSSRGIHGGCRDGEPDLTETKDFSRSHRRRHRGRSEDGRPWGSRTTRNRSAKTSWRTADRWGATRSCASPSRTRGPPPGPACDFAGNGVPQEPDGGEGGPGGATRSTPRAVAIVRSGSSTTCGVDGQLRSETRAWTRWWASSPRLT